MLLEAMALGTPCVSTDVTGIPEVVRNNVTGLLVPQSSPDECATAIQRLFNDGALRQRIGRAARDLIEAEFDVQCNAAQIRRLFSSTHVYEREVA